MKASDFVTYLHSQEDFDKFINGQPSDVLTVVDVSLQNAGACVRIFPAVLALAKNFTGFAHFARIIADESHSTQEAVKEYNVVEVSLDLAFYVLTYTCAFGSTDARGVIALVIAGRHAIRLFSCHFA